MIFNTWTFGVFLIAFLLIYWLILRPRWRPAGLFIASLLFYTYNYPLYTILITLLSLMVYFSGRLIIHLKETGTSSAKKYGGWLLFASILVCVLVLGYFKYLRMIISTINGLFASFGKTQLFPIPDILVPLGLSFFIFEFIHYLVDTWHGRTKKVNLLEFGIFAIFFPTLVSGPIKRFQPFIDQLKSPQQFKPEYLIDGSKRVLIGLSKKILVADFIGAYSLPLKEFVHNPGTSPWVLWLAAYAYAIKIYFDFFGYTDIAIGCAKLLGFKVPENFNKPYLRQNIAEFWKYWHMSLTSWLKDYIYMPVGKKLMPTIGKKSPLLLATICQMVTMAVSGLWHGANWNFLVWGLYHGAGLSIHRAFNDGLNKFRSSRNRKGNAENEPIQDTMDNKFVQVSKKVVFTFLTFQFVCIGWVFFVLNIHEALGVLKHMLWIDKLLQLL